MKQYLRDKAGAVMLLLVGGAFGSTGTWAVERTPLPALLGLPQPDSDAALALEKCTPQTAEENVYFASCSGIF